MPCLSSKCARRTKAQGAPEGNVGDLPRNATLGIPNTLCIENVANVILLSCKPAANQR